MSACPSLTPLCRWLDAVIHCHASQILIPLVLSSAAAGRGTRAFHSGGAKDRGANSAANNTCVGLVPGREDTLCQVGVMDAALQTGQFRPANSQ